MEPGFRTRLADCRVGIIGLGLMGGSLALALQEARVDRSAVTMLIQTRRIRRSIAGSSTARSICAATKSIY